jgi:hypothetical protein
MRQMLPMLASIPSEVIRYLDRHYGAATVLLTAVLVAVTAYYATQNRRMVKEMAKTRELSVMPKLALEFHRLGPTSMTVAIKNVGLGAALELDVWLRYEPVPGRTAQEERRWRRNVLAPGEQKDFLPPGNLDGNSNTLTANFRSIRLTGSMKDALGNKHSVDESFDDLAEWRTILADAHQRWVAADPERRVADELGKKFEGPLKAIVQAIDGSTRALYDLRDRPEGDDPEAH